MCVDFFFIYFSKYPAAAVSEEDGEEGVRLLPFLLLSSCSGFPTERERERVIERVKQRARV